MGHAKLDLLQREARRGFNRKLVLLADAVARGYTSFRGQQYVSLTTLRGDINETLGMHAMDQPQG
jgi:hypothetical protein